MSATGWVDGSVARGLKMEPEGYSSESHFSMERTSQLLLLPRRHQHPDTSVSSGCRVTEPIRVECDGEEGGATAGVRMLLDCKTAVQQKCGSCVETQWVST